MAEIISSTNPKKWWRFKQTDIKDYGGSSWNMKKACSWDALKLKTKRNVIIMGHGVCGNIV